MDVFLTGGAIIDLPHVKEDATKLARDIAAGRRNPVKCVLVGVGDKIDERQMEELDDLDTGTGVDCGTTRSRRRCAARWKSSPRWWTRIAS